MYKNVHKGAQMALYKAKEINLEIKYENTVSELQFVVSSYSGSVTFHIQ